MIRVYNEIKGANQINEPSKMFTCRQVLDTSFLFEQTKQILYKQRNMEMKKYQDQQGQLLNGQELFSAESIKTDIIKICQQSYNLIKQEWNGQQCFSCALMHKFFQNLVHLHSQDVTEVLRRKIQEHFQNGRKCERIKKCQEKECANKLCYGYGKKEDNKFQKGSVLNFLQNMLSVIINSDCKNQRRGSWERDNALLDIQYEINCSCSICKKVIQNHTSSDKTITDRKSEENICRQIASLKDVCNCFLNGEEKLSSAEEKDRGKIQKILNQIKEERRVAEGVKQKKKNESLKLWAAIGNLMTLDYQKFQQNYCFDKLQAKKQKIYSQLHSKNNVNRKMIRRFKRHSQISTKTSSVNFILNQKLKKQECPSISTDESINLSNKANSQKFVANDDNIQSQSCPRTLLIRKRSIKLSPLEINFNDSTNLSNLHRKIKQNCKQLQQQQKRASSQRKSILKSVIMDGTFIFESQRKGRKFRRRLNESLFTKRVEQSFSFNNNLIDIGGLNLRLNTNLRDYRYKPRQSLNIIL